MDYLLKANTSQCHFDPSVLVSILSNTMGMRSVPPRHDSCLFLRARSLCLYIEQWVESKGDPKGVEIFYRAIDIGNSRLKLFLTSGACFDR